MSWIHTHTGKSLDLLDPQPDQICIEDVAHALGRVGRYTGHSHHFYSVAEHSVLCRRHVDISEFRRDDLEGQRRLRRQTLMHDATEAYVNDLASPLKRLCADYQAIEARVWIAIVAHFGLDLVHPFEVRKIDLRMLATEAPQVLPWPPPRSWDLPVWAKPIPNVMIECWSPDTATETFLSEYRALSEPA